MFVLDATAEAEYWTHAKALLSEVAQEEFVSGKPILMCVSVACAGEILTQWARSGL